MLSILYSEEIIEKKNKNEPTKKNSIRKTNI